MRLVVQKVKQASVRIEKKIHGKIGNGLLLFVGIEKNDSMNDIEYVADKVLQHYRRMHVPQPANPDQDKGARNCGIKPRQRRSCRRRFVLVIVLVHAYSPSISLACCKAGSRIVIRIAMIAMTTRSSIKVKLIERFILRIKPGQANSSIKIKRFFQIIITLLLNYFCYNSPWIFPI